MNKLDKDYQALLQDILDNGHRKGDRTGTGTISVFGRQIRHNMKDGFPLLTTKKMFFKGIVTELLWFLRGDTNIKFLVDNECHIWDGDAFKKYVTKYKGNFPLDIEEFVEAIKTSEEFAETYGELGPVYGKQWRSWDNYQITNYNGVEQIDQITNLINDLKTNPDSRRLMVNAWNVGELDQMTLPPCHYGFQVYTRELRLNERLNLASTIIGEENIRTHEDNLERVEKLNIPTRAISLMWNQRSVDTFLGLPFNIASYGLLLEIIAKAVNMVPDQLIGNLGDTHLYSNHIEQAKEQIGRELTLDERTDLWFNNNKPNRDVVDSFDDADDFFKYDYLDSAKVPKRTREPYPLPTLDIHPGILDYDLDKLEIDMFKILDYQSHPTIKAQISN
jgi:thymidylate synthase